MSGEIGFGMIEVRCTFTFSESKAKEAEVHNFYVSRDL